MTATMTSTLLNKPMGSACDEPARNDDENDRKCALDVMLANLVHQDRTDDDPWQRTDEEGQKEHPFDIAEPQMAEACSERQRDRMDDVSADDAPEIQPQRIKED